MTRTKWMRLIVHDLSDIVRWASRQNARHIDDFRYRVVNGRESVSFRMVPAYPIEVGTRDIFVICHVRLGVRRYLAERVARGLRRMGSRLGAAAAPQPTAPVVAASGARNAEIHILPWVRSTSPSAP